MIRIHFGPQTVDQHVHHVCLWIETVIPDVLENHRLRHRPADMAQQESQQGELLWLELDQLTRRPHLPGGEVEFEVRRVASGARVARRMSACTRASSSENANGLVR